MSLNKPVLDDRSFAQIRDELIAKIPIYAPEWTDHNPSDPGITLIELFSFLTENLLYRFNQIPDATKLEFLRLLQIPLLKAEPAKAMLTFTAKELLDNRVDIGTQIRSGDVAFSTQNEVTVLPVELMAVIKEIEQLPEEDSEQALFYEQAAASVNASKTVPYKVSTISPQPANTAVDVDSSVDGIVWLAVLADKANKVTSVRQQLFAGNGEIKGKARLFNIGFTPEKRLTDDELRQIDDVSRQAYADRFRCPGQNNAPLGNTMYWQISSGRISGAEEPIFTPLQVVGDTSFGLTEEGVIRLQLPTNLDNAGRFEFDDLNVQGIGNFPPVLDDGTEARVVCWLRGFRNDGTGIGKVRYFGANAVMAEQTVTAGAELLGTGNGQPLQIFPLNHTQVVSQSAVLQVEEPQGWVDWQEVTGFFASTESDRHYMLDSATGQVRFGNGINGKRVDIGQRVRVLEYRYGGGAKGNVAPESINKLIGSAHLKVHNPMPAFGGQDAESLEQALERIPGELRRRNRAVTQSDFSELAVLTPGADVGRAEVIPRYHPQLPDSESAGVISVVVWPREDKLSPNAPLPDTDQLGKVCKWLDARRLVTTELFVLPPAYVSVAVAVGVKVKKGYGIDAVRHWVELAIRQYLAPLPPYGPEGKGWPLGRRIHAAELEAAAHQVEGVEYLEGLSLVGWDRAGNKMSNIVELLKNEVPELIGISVENGPPTLAPGENLAPQDDGTVPVPVPVLREVC